MRVASTSAASVHAAAHVLIIWKSSRELQLYQSVGEQRVLVTTCRIALGSQPLGPKRREGDGATPEGNYFITHKNGSSKYHLSLGISYPNLDDAAAGLNAGLINKEQLCSIATSLRNGQKPLQHTGLGGDIFIHGGGSARDWTAGCIALENSDIEQLFECLALRTPITILP